MKKILNLAWAFALIVGFVCVGRSATTCAPSDMYCYEAGPTASLATIGRLDSTGSLFVVGTSTTGARSVLVPSAFVSVSTQIPISPLTATNIVVKSTGGFVSFATGSSYPAISTSTALTGQYIVVHATSTADYVIIATGTATGVVGSDQYIVISGSKSAVGFIYDPYLASWVEIGKQN